MVSNKPPFFGVVAQLASASRLQREGSEFESLSLHCVSSLCGKTSGCGSDEEGSNPPNTQQIGQYPPTLIM